MNVRKVFVKKNNLAAIKCLECGFLKNLSVAKYRHNRKPLTIRCRCKNTFAISLDFRRHYRKPVVLSGVYEMQPPSEDKGRMRIKNISFSGIGFTVESPHAIQSGQEGRVEFTLNNRKRSEIKKKIEVIAVNKNYVGCTFTDIQPFEKDLGFFLRF